MGSYEELCILRTVLTSAARLRGEVLSEAMRSYEELCGAMWSYVEL
jgi:hypothetical protein